MDSSSRGDAPLLPSLPSSPSGPRPISVVDKRRVGRTADAPSAEPNLKPSYVQELEAKTAKAEAAVARRLAELDAEAQRARTRIQADLELRFAKREAEILLEVLVLCDDIDRARQLAAEAPALAAGLALVAGGVERFLLARGCEKFSPEWEAFDPERMEAVMAVEGPAGTVVQVVRPGYTRGEMLLRPAQVAVGMG